MSFVDDCPRVGESGIHTVKGKCGVNNSKESNGMFERRIQSIIQIVITAMVMWVGYTVLGVRDSAIRQEVQNVQTAKDIATLTAMSTR